MLPASKVFLLNPNYQPVVNVFQYLILDSVERKKAPTPLKDLDKKDEENWPLKNVIFVEDVKTVPMGKVVKVTKSVCYGMSRLKGQQLNKIYKHKTKGCPVRLLYTGIFLVSVTSSNYFACLKFAQTWVSAQRIKKQLLIRSFLNSLSIDVSKRGKNITEALFPSIQY